MISHEFISFSLFICSSLHTVVTLGVPKEAPEVIDYDDDSLFDGKPVVHRESRRQGDHKFEGVYPERYPGVHPEEYLRDGTGNPSGLRQNNQNTNGADQKNQVDPNNPRGQGQVEPNNLGGSGNPSSANPNDQNQNDKGQNNLVGPKGSQEQGGKGGSKNKGGSEKGGGTKNKGNPEDTNNNQYDYNQGESKEEEGKKKDETVPTGMTTAKEHYHNVIESDYMSVDDKYVIQHLINQIYSESETKVHEVNLIIEMHTPALSFEVGKIIGLIQARYRHQMELWREVSDKEVKFGYNPKTRMWPAAWSTYKLYDKRSFWRLIAAATTARMNNYYITVYAMIFEIERDIEKLIDVLLAIPREDLQLPPFTIKLSIPPKQQTTAIPLDDAEPSAEALDAAEPPVAEPPAAQPPVTQPPVTQPPVTQPPVTQPPVAQPPEAPPAAPPVLRKRADELPKWVPGGAVFRRGVNFEEERLKHRLREQFLLRRLGQNESGHTLKPRFRMGWPVEETWDNIPLY